MIAAELREQLLYQRRLSHSLGLLPGLAARARMLARRTGLPFAEAVRLHPPSVLHPVEVRVGTSDVSVYRQVLVDREYGALDAVEDVQVIVDCGANVGYAGAYLLSRHPRARLIALEPFPANAEQCHRNLRHYGRAEVRRAAIWSRDGKLAMDCLQPGNEWGVTVHEAAPGEAGDVDALAIPSLGEPRIDILKIDIERSEIELFGNAAERWLPSVRNIAIELHDQACEDVFFRALAPYRYDQSRSGELTILRNIRRG
jgi:FkbM family methyltransferase